ncbi:hypothetical protein [Glaciecola punicea]|jgi:hypothetical protein|nr:hypothetical protein [Glaciecola punicea]
MQPLSLTSKNGPLFEQDTKNVWHLFAKHYCFFCGSPTKRWLNYMFTGICFVVAAWKQYVSGFKPKNLAAKAQEPKTGVLAQIGKQYASQTERWLSDTMCQDTVFGRDLEFQVYLSHNLVTCLEQLRVNADIELAVTEFMDTTQ